MLFSSESLDRAVGQAQRRVADAQAHILKIAGLLEELHPSSVYLASSNVCQVLQRIAREHPQEWVDFVIAYLTEQGYGKAHGLAGYQGVIQFYEMRQALELELMPQLGWHHWIMGNSDWDACEKLCVYFEQLSAQVG